ncbi:hypothetical protein B0T25DRAFT_209795 [Lasiosphaeria hispida]|uniref:Zn(2)-C6 fungal-type domain-containing protein n=1 Tax=Lasiosphaeria hispida TaxID=260671 RepID=A0AAJ0HIU3_9PEZI|nr:hypothetical protein B0T25DRAFT_209795 [Lasiosphaeria hispida]
MADDTAESYKERARACAYCNRSKTKCIWPGEPGFGTCERCIRLKRSCGLPEQGERRRRGPSTRVGQLEEKIDGIMSLLNASRQLQQQASPSSPTYSSPNSSRLAPIHPAHVGVADHDPQRTRLAHNSPRVPVSSLAHNTPPIDFFEIVPGLRVSVDEADRLLELYRTDCAPKFPFVRIPRCLTAYELSERQPFLFRAVIQVMAPQNALIQRDVARWIREQIAERVVVNQEKTLEILQALLIFIAWGELHFYIDPRGTNLLQIAAGLVIELGLNRPVKAGGRDLAVPSHVSNHFVDEARRLKGVRARPPHTLEDMRAFLGCFYINSMVAILFRHLPMLPYNNYVTTCRVNLETAQEYESDKFLCSLIRMQRVGCRMHALFPSVDMDGCEPADFSGPLHMTMSTLRAEMEAVRAEVPKDIQTHWHFEVCYHGLLLKLYEPATYMQPSSASSSFTEASWRTEALWSCLESAKAFFDAFSSIPAEELPYLPSPVFSHLSFAIVATSALFFLGDSDWDQAVVRRTIDFPNLVQRLSDRFDQADRVAAADGWKRKNKLVDDARPVMAMYRDKLRWIASWFLSKRGGTDEPQPPGADANAMDLDPAGFFAPADFDGDWWQALLGDRDDSFGQMEQSEGSSRQ